MPPQKGARYQTEQRRMIETQGVKPCVSCDTVKPISEFHKNSKKASGLEPHCKACRSEYFRKSGHYQRVRDQKFKYRYGITVIERDAIIAAQDGKCRICQTEPDRWHTDHCHVSGKFRGMICGHCNSLLGFAKDDPQVLRRAIEYLEES